MNSRRRVSFQLREDDTMVTANSRVTIHMAASLDGFIARKDGSVDWLETSDEFAGGDTMDPAFVETFLKTIDCYVMGSRTLPAISGGSYVYSDGQNVYGSGTLSSERCEIAN